jgi:hypothetical protein
MALRKEFLRQHYLDQVHGSFAFRAKLSAFAPPAGQVGSPNIMQIRAVWLEGQAGEYEDFPKSN